MACTSPRFFACTLNAAGLASWTLAVVTSPMRFPRAFAASMTVRRDWPSGPTPIAPIVVLTPVDMVVAVAAESVANASWGCVVKRPSVPVFNTTSVTAKGSFRRCRAA